MPCVAFFQRFITDVENGIHREQGWPNTAYGVSKVGVAAMTRIQARDISKIAPESSGVLVNCCCPGWCKSDMAGWDRPTKTATEGADTPLCLALLPKGSDIHGKFLADRAIRSW